MKPGVRAINILFISSLSTEINQQFNILLHDLVDENKWKVPIVLFCSLNIFSSQRLCAAILANTNAHTLYV